jgi:hypothetical protein
VNRRAFIGALFGAAAAAAIPEDPQQAIAPPAKTPEQWWQHYTYCFATEMRGDKTYTLELAVDRDFWMSHIQWTMPEGTRVAVRESGKLLFEMAMPGMFTGPFSSFPVMPDLFVAAGTSLSVDFRNPEGQFLMSPAMLAMTGRRAMTEAEIASWNTKEKDDEDDGFYEDEEEL